MDRYIILTVFICFVPSGVFAQNQSSPVAKEYMATDRLLIMNKLPMVTTKDSLVSLLGIPDSTIVRNEGEMCTNYFYGTCPNQYNVLVWDETQVETCNNKAVLQIINFKENPDIFVTYAKKIQLSSETTIDSLRNYYPNSVKNLHKIDVYQKGRYDTFSLPSKKVRAESAWMFFFKEGKLVRMDFWSPC